MVENDFGSADPDPAAELADLGRVDAGWVEAAVAGLPDPAAELADLGAVDAGWVEAAVAGLPDPAAELDQRSADEEE